MFFRRMMTKSLLYERETERRDRGCFAFLFLHRRKNPGPKSSLRSILYTTANVLSDRKEEEEGRRGKDPLALTSSSGASAKKMGEDGRCSNREKVGRRSAIVQKPFPPTRHPPNHPASSAVAPTTYVIRLLKTHLPSTYCTYAVEPRIPSGMKEKENVSADREAGRGGITGLYPPPSGG